MNENIKPLEVRLNEKQIEVYKLYIDATKQLVDTINQFDGKVLNVRFDRALKEIQSLKDLELWVHVSGGQIHLSSRYDYIETHPNEEYSCCSYIRDRDYECIISLDDKRINAKDTLLCMEDKNKNTLLRIQALEKANKLYDDMLKEYAKIKKMITDYKEKYDYSIRENYSRF